MKIAFLDLFCGLSGDMTLGALVDTGLPLTELRKGLARLPLKGYRLSARRVLKGAISATKVTVRVDESAHRHHHTPLKTILGLIRRSGLPSAVKERASDVFLRLGRAEGRIHGVDPMKVEFHEVGAVDSIVDIVGACLGFHLLGVEEVYCSRVPVTRGEIRTHHGALPNPGPATIALLNGFPLTPLDLDREVVTPTGAALLASLVRRPGRFPEMVLTASGYGAGDWDLPERANVVRLLVGEAASAEESDAVFLVETNLDNVAGELVGYLYEKLFAAGALDVYSTPILMKKSRPAVKISVLTPPSRRAAVEALLLRETPTFGVRRVLMERSKLPRREITVQTPYGPIRCKVGRLNGRTLKAAPEYEDARAAAEHHGVPLSAVQEAALRAFRKGSSITH
ncbi:MAG TPA: nickel pincer cofactor biosynthesis protein LarC [Planctomycetota bacterium]|nr:nickel pincer cofactor biosynthesis protein LarC [Planctomycetota bacterium]